MFYNSKLEPFNLALDSDQALDPVKLNLIRNNQVFIELAKDDVSNFS